MGWDGMGDTYLTSSDGLTTPPDTPDDDADPPLAHDALVGATLAVLAERDLAERQRQTHLDPIGDARTWTARAQDQRRERHADLITQFATSHPTATPAELANLVEPHSARQNGTRTDPLDGQQQAQRTAQEQHMRTVRQLATEEPDADRNVAAIHSIRQRHPLATAPPGDP